MFKTHERGGYCYHCRRRVLARARELNMQTHTAAIILSCGLYLPVFVLVVLLHGIGNTLRGGYLCTQCGGRVR